MSLLDPLGKACFVLFFYFSFESAAHVYLAYSVARVAKRQISCSPARSSPVRLKRLHTHTHTLSHSLSNTHRFRALGGDLSLHLLSEE